MSGAGDEHGAGHHHQTVRTRRWRTRRLLLGALTVLTVLTVLMVVMSATQSANMSSGQTLTAMPRPGAQASTQEESNRIGSGSSESHEVAPWHAVRNYPLWVVVSKPVRSILREWMPTVRWMVIGYITAAAVMFFMAWLAWRTALNQTAIRRQLNLSQATIAAREREVNAILENVQELIFRTDPQGVLAFVNPRWTALTGKPHDSLLGRPLADVVTMASRRKMGWLFAAEPEGELRRTRVWIEGLGGVSHTLDITLAPLLENERLTGFAGSAVDVSGLLQAQADLQAQLQFIAALIEHNPLPITVMDRQQRLQQVNRAWEIYTGLHRRDVLGQPASAAWPALKIPAEQYDNDQALARGEVRQREVAYTHRDGSQRDLYVSTSPLPAPNGQSAGTLMVCMDVSQFREAERQVLLAKNAAERASIAKSEFVANISHELRTPLQSILGFSELGLSRGKDQPRLGEMFQNVHAAGTRMLALVNDLLDLSKLDGPVGGLQIARHDIRDLLHEVAAEMYPQLAAKKLDLQVRLPIAPMVAKVDPVRFQQVIRNVLANAIRFSPERAPIHLSGRVTSDGRVAIDVTDHGPGIPPQELETIFDAFVQSSRTKSGAGGTGLGLGICRKIMDRLDGQIRAVNTDSGGSCFRIRLPQANFGETQPGPL